MLDNACTLSILEKPSWYIKTTAFKDKIIIGEINGILSELSTPVMTSCEVKFYDRNSSTGNKVYLKPEIASIRALLMGLNFVQSLHALNFLERIIEGELKRYTPKE